ncbi:3-isopropylmalate dehydratase [Mycolicibacterium sp. P9-64]|uniref:LeuD/DmdB family oxidoreductase small subunit n=1 Tax=Mycolicibacterium sp. P9-64 TaxID=2024612 RepID=UPI0011ECA1B3|nr:3-isopropylmalate dehydratase [Mycolicibacterium sp. P9-64]KAA0082654.1 3-isopropylmalate dehydratase [Mycolicibacterium sp. P9-64]
MTLTVARGQAWVFGDEVNTDDMYPGFAMKLPPTEAAKHMFDATRPDWPSLVQPGDIVVAGRNFGLGSSRPVAELFKELQVSCLIAEQFNSLFHRNVLNYGLPAIVLPEARAIIAEGDVLEIDFLAAELHNQTRASMHHFDPFPAFVVDMLSAGGLMNQLEAAGYLRTTEPEDRKQSI